MYLVRVKEFERRNYKVIAEFENKKDAMKYAIKLERKWRNDFDKMFDKIDIKYPNGCRFLLN